MQAFLGRGIRLCIALFVRSVLQGLVHFAYTSSRRGLPPRGATASGLGRRRNALEEMRTLRCQLRAGKDLFWDLPFEAGRAIGKGMRRARPAPRRFR